MTCGVNMIKFNNFKIYLNFYNNLILGLFYFIRKVDEQPKL